jgi:hypothetical protein
MAIQMGKTLALTAVGGMVAGLVGCGSAPTPPTDPAAAAPGADPAAAVPSPGAKDCCKGKNECKGKGNCKVEGAQDCKGKNECKGKGGCKAPDCAGGDAPAVPAP